MQCNGYGRVDQALRDQLLAIIDCYRDDTRALVRYLEEADLQLDQAGLIAYVEHMRDCGYKASTINKRLQGAKNRLRLLFRRSGAAYNVLDRYEMESALKEIKGVKKNTKAVDLEKTLTIEEVKQLLGAEYISKRVHLLIEFLVSTGVRVSELTGILLTDIRPEHGYTSIRIMGKGSKERFLKVAEDLVRRIQAQFRGTHYLFETIHHSRFTREHITKAVHDAGKTVLQRSISAHTLRHTFATIQVRKNRKVKALSVYLGHSTTSITQDMYVHEELDLDDLNMGLS